MLERSTSIRFNDKCINAGFFETARMERREVEETLAAILEQDSCRVRRVGRKPSLEASETYEERASIPCAKIIVGLQYLLGSVGF